MTLIFLMRKIVIVKITWTIPTEICLVHSQIKKNEKIYVFGFVVFFFFFLSLFFPQHHIESRVSNVASSSICI
jgi:hypothetical protein